MNSPHKLMEKKIIFKNISVMCVGAFTLFTAYDGPTMLQSTMNKEGGIGVVSLALNYAFFCISALLLPKYVIKRFGSKTTLVISMILYIPYIASNYYPHWVVMIPVSILIGSSAALLWSSQATYLNDLSIMLASQCVSHEENDIYHIENNHSLCNCQQQAEVNYQCASDKGKPEIQNALSEEILSQHVELNRTLNNKDQENDSGHRIVNNGLLEDGNINGTVNILNLRQSRNKCEAQSDKCKSNLELKQKKVESITARVFGIHGMSFLLSHLFGNVLSYFILKRDAGDQFLSKNSSCVCGANYCNENPECLTNNIGEISYNTRILLTTVCVSLSVVSVFIIGFFLDPLESASERSSFSLNFLMATLKIVKRSDIILLIPSTLYLGQVQGFFAGEFHKAFVGCAWGTYHVSLVSICYGFMCAVFATCSGWMVKFLGRIFVFTFAAFLCVASNLLLLLWIPDPQHSEVFIISAGIIGAYVGMMWSQLRAFYGILFKAEEEAAFGAFYVWYSIGFCLSFAYSTYFCTFVKIYVMLIISNLGYIGYLIVENKFSNSFSCKTVNPT